MSQPEFHKVHKEDDKGLIKIVDIKKWHDRFYEKTGNNIPGILPTHTATAQKNNSGREIIISRKTLPYNLAEYLKFNLLDCEKQWIAYQLLLTIEEVI